MRMLVLPRTRRCAAASPRTRDRRCCSFAARVTRLLSPLRRPPRPSCARHQKPGSGLRLARLARRFDRLIVHFQPEMLGDPGTPRSVRARAFLRLAAGLCVAPSADLCLHEVVYGEGAVDLVLRTLVRPVLKLADVLTVHTERERNDLSQGYRLDRIGSAWSAKARILCGAQPGIRRGARCPGRAGRWHVAVRDRLSASKQGL